MGDSENASNASRYSSLDGLRGLAAFVVLIHHSFLVAPLLADAVTSREASPLAAWVWWTTFTPLHLVWAGREAVYVFFILSGFVLTLPLLRAVEPRWRSYYPQRIVRIYLPVWASIGFAVVMAWIIPRVADPAFSSWLNLHDEVSDVLRDALLLLGAGQLNSALWSLQWEMVFSLFLPLYWFVARRLHRTWLLGVTGLVLVIGAAEIMNSAGLVFLPMFGIGTLMAARRDVLRGWATRLGWRGWAGLVAVSTTMLSSHWLFPQLPVSISIATIGGALMVFTFIGCKSAIALGKNSLVHWLGTRSFSLYLIHEPIVVSVAFFLHISNPVQVALIVLPLSLLVTEAFFRLVETPSHRLAALAGRTWTDRASQKQELATP